MTSWCLNNNFLSPPMNFPSPAPLDGCTWPLKQRCNSKAIADACGVRTIFIKFIRFNLKRQVELFKSRNITMCVPLRSKISSHHLHLLRK